MRLPSYKFSSSPLVPTPIDNVSTITPPPSPPPAMASSIDSSMTTPSTHHRIHLESPPPSLTPPRTRRGSTSTVPTITRSFNRPHSDSLPPPYEPPPPGSASTASLSAKRPTPERTPSVMVLFREDYQRTRIYVKEMDYRAALRKALRKHMYSESSLSLESSFASFQDERMLIIFVRMVCAPGHCHCHFHLDHDETRDDRQLLRAPD
ncbi:hypothetical protein BCR39DRAFT_43010 [Naematelia encephala]|uniref:Uncharacterized protein n=1 Tax=Naematelia encephala TaxID=71784 RepID=A0A1Y2BCM9_9TREE|nr:hypothetical protein BCR39DRAFT_43010 [Naematelia encephala]